MLSRERARASASRCATTRRPSDVILPGQGRFWLSSANALIAVDRDREATLTATRREKAAPRALIYISRNQKEWNDRSVYRARAKQPPRSCIASRSSIAIFSVLHFPPGHPLVPFLFPSFPRSPHSNARL